jgi:phenylacetate-coenzyme A ligase PaaK-like adenylate-forming protein
MDARQIFGISTEEEFQSLCLEVFAYQFKNSSVYREFCEYVGKNPALVKSLEDIPFLPIELFKIKEIKTMSGIDEVCFKSSGTTGRQVSTHYVADPQIYQNSFLGGFKKFYGPISDYCLLALLPSYLERQDSSLVYMVQELIKRTGHPKSGFYLDDYELLARTLKELDKQGKPVLLIGVSFALIDLANRYPMRLTNTIVMETGGMKGRRKEMIRTELHEQLKKSWGMDHIHSEYGMTELLSQAYARKEGIFYTPNWMRVLIRDTEDPFEFLPEGNTGGINIIDLANLYSCSFIATQDLGKLQPDGGFEVLGRFDHSDVRGCNLMLV